MERGSVQHGARLDDDLAAGVDEILRGGSGVERDDQAPELPVAEELTADGVDVGVGPIEGPEPAGSVSAQAARERSDLAGYLLAARFPAEGAAIVEAARLGGAPEEIVVLLGTLAPRATFATVGEVWRAVGGAAEVRSPEPTGPVASAEPEPAPAFEARTTGAGAPPLGVTPSPETVDGGPGLVLEAFHLAQLAIGLGLVPLRIGRAVAREILHRFRPRH